MSNVDYNKPDNQSNNSSTSELQEEINSFVEKQKKNFNIKVPRNNNLVLVYTFFCDILGSVLTAFIINSIYKHFFGKNNLVFVFLIIFCIMGGFYGYFKTITQKNKK